MVVHLQEGATPCGDSDEHWRDVPATWRTDNAFVVQVDSIVGRVTGLRVGDARVFAGSGDVLNVLVHVR